MEIPNVKELRKSIIEEREKFNKEKLDNLLKYRIETRKKWSEKEIKKYDKFLKKLKTAHDNYVIALKNEIIAKTKLVLQEDPEAKGFNLAEPQLIDADIGKFNGNTIYRGLWDKRKKKYSRISHLEAGIKKTPLEEVIEMFATHGFNIKDSSNVELDEITITVEFE